MTCASTSGGKRTASSLRDHHFATDAVRMELSERAGWGDEPAAITAHCVYWCISGIVCPQPDHVGELIDLCAMATSCSDFVRAAQYVSVPPSHTPTGRRCARCLAGPDDDAARKCRLLRMAFLGGERRELSWTAKRLRYRPRDYLRREENARMIELL